INTTTGVLEINKIYLDVGRNFKAGRWNTFWTIALPGALPVIMTGFKLGIGIGLVLFEVAEMVGAKSGLGYLIWSAWSTFAVEQMYVGLFVIAIIGFLITLTLNELERVITPGKAEGRPPAAPVVPSRPGSPGVPRDGKKHDGDDRRGKTMLDVHARRAGFEPGKNARQRARRHEPVN